MAAVKQKYITIRGAKLHNLKNVSVDIPQNQFTVITGVSGSGKSSLAFDTLFAEGQRRFVESLSSYARQFLERMHRPDVDSIGGLPPAIAIEQRPSQKNPRSTVGTTTEIYDYLRLLYGRIGKTVCKCGRDVQKDSPDTVVAYCEQFRDGDKLFVLFPLDHQSKSVSSELESIKQAGFFRLVLKESDDIIEFDDYKKSKNKSNDEVYIVADRLVYHRDDESRSRFTESIEAAFRSGEGKIIIRNLAESRDYRFSSRYECPDCEIVYEEPEPRLFSFNNPYGACPSCQGFGRTIDIDEDLVIPDKYTTLKRSPIHPFRTVAYQEHHRALLAIAHKYKIPVDVPIKDLTEAQMDIIWNGKDDYLGVAGFFAMLEDKSYKIQNRVMLARYRGYTRCKACGGSRIRTSARQVFVSGKNLPELVKMSLGTLHNFINNIQLTNYEEQVTGQLQREILWRLQLLVDIGLDYLSLDRLAHSLSGGEMQRINLSTALGSALVGTLYVLDEPSIGMHPRDTERLIKILFKLRNLGNTIVVVEHDPDIISKADYIIDMGPEAGSGGGNVVFAGDVPSMLRSKASLTGNYMSGRKSIEIQPTRITNTGVSIDLKRPRLNNLKMDSVSFPLGCMTVVTGVSGSGKSTLVHDVLYEGLKRHLQSLEVKSGLCESIFINGKLRKVELVDQSSIGKSSRSTPITYTKTFDLIRELFSQTQAAKQFGYKPGYFSFNVPGGRCEVCEGEGAVTVDMQFLPDVQLECEACKGTRYKKETRSILYKGKSIVDVLNMTVDEALEFFSAESRIAKKIRILHEVGLGYLCLGQPSSMLSGGESQRVKLASHLDTNQNEETLFIFDEPTTGLHLHDISKLLECFRRLVQNNHSVLIIEHNIHIIAAADHIIDLGPDGGDAGGDLVAVGTPEDIMRFEYSYTGEALRKFYAK